MWFLSPALVAHLLSSAFLILVLLSRRAVNVAAKRSDTYSGEESPSLFKMAFLIFCGSDCEYNLLIMKYPYHKAVSVAIWY